MDVINLRSHSIVAVCSSNIIEFHFTTESGIRTLSSPWSCADSEIRSFALSASEENDSFHCIIALQERIFILYCLNEKGFVSSSVQEFHFEGTVVRVRAGLRAGSAVVATSSAVYVLAFPPGRVGGEVTIHPCTLTSLASASASSMVLSISHASSIKLYLDYTDFVLFNSREGEAPAGLGEPDCSCPAIQGALLCTDFSSNFPVLLWVSINMPEEIQPAGTISGGAATKLMSMEVAYKYPFVEKDYTASVYVTSRLAPGAPLMATLFVSTATAVYSFGPSGLQTITPLSSISAATGSSISGLVLLGPGHLGEESSGEGSQLVVSCESGRYHLLDCVAAAPTSASIVALEVCDRELLTFPFTPHPERSAAAGGMALSLRLQLQQACVHASGSDQELLEGRLKSVAVSPLLPFGVQTGMQVRGCLRAETNNLVAPPTVEEGTAAAPPTAVCFVGMHAHFGLQLLAALSRSSGLVKKGERLAAAAPTAVASAPESQPLQLVRGVRAVVPVARGCTAVTSGRPNDTRTAAAQARYDSYLLFSSHRGVSRVLLCNDGYAAIGGDERPWELSLGEDRTGALWLEAASALHHATLGGADFCLLTSKLYHRSLVFTLPTAAADADSEAETRVEAVDNTCHAADEATLLWEAVDSAGLAVQVTPSQCVFLRRDDSSGGLARVCSCDLLQRCRLQQPAAVPSGAYIQHAMLLRRGTEGRDIVLTVAIGDYIFSFGASLTPAATSGETTARVELVPVHAAHRLSSCVSCLTGVVLPSQPAHLVLFVGCWGVEGAQLPPTESAEIPGIPSTICVLYISPADGNGNGNGTGKLVAANFIPATAPTDAADEQVLTEDMDGGAAATAVAIARFMRCLCYPAEDKQGHILSLVWHGSENPPRCTRLSIVSLYVSPPPAAGSGGLTFLTGQRPVVFDVAGSAGQCTALLRTTPLLSTGASGERPVLFVQGHGDSPNYVVTQMQTQAQQSDEGIEGQLRRLQWRCTAVTTSGTACVGAVVPPASSALSSCTDDIWRYVELRCVSGTCSLRLSRISPGLTGGGTTGAAKTAKVHIRCCQRLRGVVRSHRLLHGSGSSAPAASGCYSDDVFVLLTLDGEEQHTAARPGSDSRRGFSLAMLSARTLQTVWVMPADCLDAGPLATVAIESGMSPAAALYSQPAVSSTDSSGQFTAGATDAYFVVSFRCWPKANASATTTAVHSFRVQRDCFGSVKVDRVGTLALPPAAGNTSSAEAALYVAAFGGLKYAALYSQSRGRLEIVGWSLRQQQQRLGLGAPTSKLIIGLLSAHTAADGGGVDSCAAEGTSEEPAADGNAWTVSDQGPEGSGSVHPVVGLTVHGEAICLSRFLLGVEIYCCRPTPAQTNHTSTSDTNSSESQRRRSRGTNSVGGGGGSMPGVVVEKLFVVPEPIIGFTLLAMNIRHVFRGSTTTSAGSAGSGGASAWVTARKSPDCTGFEYEIAGTSKWQQQKTREKGQTRPDFYVVRGYHSIVSTAVETASLSNLRLPLSVPARLSASESFALRIGAKAGVDITSLVAPKHPAPAPTPAPAVLPADNGAAPAETAEPAAVAPAAEVVAPAQIETAPVVVAAALPNIVTGAGDTVSVAKTVPTVSVLACEEGEILSNVSITLGIGTTAACAPSEALSVVYSSNRASRTCHTIDLHGHL